MDDFAAATAVERLGDGRFSARIPDGWQQGRGAFGGVVLGTLARALIGSDGDATRSLRTLSGDICGPVLPGPAEITTRVLRRGSNQSNVAAELRQNGDVLVLASATLSTPRPMPGASAAPTSPTPDWHDAPVFPLGPPIGAVFAAHYEYRTRMLPTGNAGEPRAEGFIRERAPLHTIDAPALIGRLDAWWPALFNFAGIRPMATISFTAEILCDPATLAPDEPLHYRSRIGGLHDGFCVELRELCHRDRVVALNQQTFAIIK